MALMIYACQECRSEFTMDDRLVGNCNDLGCPICAGKGTVCPVVVDEKDEDEDEDQDEDEDEDQDETPARSNRTRR